MAKFAKKWKRRNKNSPRLWRVNRIQLPKNQGYLLPKNKEISKKIEKKEQELAKALAS